jgi:hypothetical protein
MAMKGKRVLVFGILLVFGLLIMTCDNGNNSNSSGTIRIRITDIPGNVMLHGQSGQILIGIGPANQLSKDGSNALAGRNTDIFADDDKMGSNWFEFSLYNITNYNLYIGSSGNYDIGFIDSSNSTTKVIRNKRLEANTTNVFSYDSFQTF